MAEGFDTPGEITSDDKLWALLSWIFAPLIPIIVLLMDDKKGRPFIKYNAVHALAVVVVGWAVSAVLSAVIIGCFIGVAVLIYQIYLAVQAYNGTWVKVPVLTDFLQGQGWL